MNVSVKDVSFTYANSPIIQNLSLEIHHEEFVSLIGPSGCGKSTFLLMLGGLLQPTQGEIWLDKEGKRGSVGYMPQSYSLFPWYTVKENIQLAQRWNTHPSVQVEKWLEKAKLQDTAHLYPHQLSGGMQQRVAFLRALASDKSLLCLDEPFGQLDALTRTAMQKWLSSILEAEGRTILLVTHSIEEAMLLSDRIYVLAPRPTNVQKEIVIPFPRHKRHLLRGTSEWMAYQLEIESYLGESV